MRKNKKEKKTIGSTVRTVYRKKVKERIKQAFNPVTLLIAGTVLTGRGESEKYDFL